MESSSENRILGLMLQAGFSQPTRVAVGAILFRMLRFGYYRAAVPEQSGNTSDLPTIRPQRSASAGMAYSAPLCEVLFKPRHILDRNSLDSRTDNASLSDADLSHSLLRLSSARQQYIDAKRNEKRWHGRYGRPDPERENEQMSVLVCRWHR